MHSVPHRSLTVSIQSHNTVIVSSSKFHIGRYYQHNIVWTGPCSHCIMSSVWWVSACLCSWIIHNATKIFSTTACLRQRTGKYFRALQYCGVTIYSTSTPTHQHDSQTTQSLHYNQFTVYARTRSMWEYGTWHTDWQIPIESERERCQMSLLVQFASWRRKSVDSHADTDQDWPVGDHWLLTSDQSNQIDVAVKTNNSVHLLACCPASFSFPFLSASSCRQSLKLYNEDGTQEAIRSAHPTSVRVGWRSAAGGATGHV